MSSSARRTVRAATGALVLTAALAPASAEACSLVFDTPPHRVAGATVALTVQVTAVRELGPISEDRAGTRFEATLRVSRLYKGTTGRHIGLGSRIAYAQLERVTGHRSRRP